MTDTPAPIVREARPEDLPRLLVLMQQLSANGARPETEVQTATDRHQEALEDLLRDSRCHLLVIEDGSEVLGTCALYIVPNLSHGAAPWSIVENVVVDDRLRSRGYGELLMAEAERLAKEQGAYRLSLMSNERRSDAHRFYRRLGYEPSHQGFTKYFI
ncbi:MAG TPA: GNAT family N-acetyltransferase [Dehalococcoidia bacterium]|nr:GNAT family N-acetyltransferase [Dehalococcoidia bacterium]